MNDPKPAGLRVNPFFLGVMLPLVMSSALTQAATLWTGPNISFTESAGSPTDVIVAGKVVLSRGSNQVLYNTAAGETAAGTSSPLDTEWALGVLNNFSSLTYQSLESMRNGDLAAVILNQPMVMHLINENTYLSVRFTAWGQHGAGGFSYTRSTAAVSTKPTVSITSPSGGAVFTAPARVQLTASATVNGGTVTNVAYFAGSTRLGNASVSPFSVTGTITNPGSYNLTAVATASGISSTSAVVNISIISPVPVSQSSPVVNNGLFSFSYNADPGVSYVVERSVDLLGWVSVVTNVAGRNPVLFTDAVDPSAPHFYRVARLTGP